MIVASQGCSSTGRVQWLLFMFTICFVNLLIGLLSTTHVYITLHPAGNVVYNDLGPFNICYYASTSSACAPIALNQCAFEVPNFIGFIHDCTQFNAFRVLLVIADALLGILILVTMFCFYAIITGKGSLLPVIRSVMLLLTGLCLVTNVVSIILFEVKLSSLSSADDVVRGWTYYLQVATASLCLSQFIRIACLLQFQQPTTPARNATPQSVSTVATAQPANTLSAPLLSTENAV